MATTIDDVESAAARDALGDKLFQAVLGVWDVYAVHLGSRLGLYQTLTAIEPATSGELAAAGGWSERYVREWLEQQAVSGILACENPADAADERRFVFPAGHAEALTDHDDPGYIAPLAQIAVGAVGPIEAVMAAFRDGGGVRYEDYGADLRDGQAGMNRNLFLQQLGDEYLPALADIDARLRADPPAQVADIGCGLGWSSIGIARAYPKVRVDGFDLDAASVAAAQTAIAAAGVSDRVSVKIVDAADLDLAGRYDLVTAFECIHDMSDPVGALATMRRLLAPGGAVLVMDERVGERFDPAAGDIERLMYGFSVFHCLPVGLADAPSVGTGTVMRPETLRRYAKEAGFREIEILPLENLFFNFYRLIA